MNIHVWGTLSLLAGLPWVKLMKSPQRSLLAFLLVVAQLPVVVACDTSKAAESPPASEQEQAAPEEVTCEVLVDHMVTVFEPAGDAAFIRKANRKEALAACTKADDLAKKKEEVACVMDATTLKALNACDIGSLMKNW